MNNIVLIGRLTKDPEMKVSNNDKEYCLFSLAVNRPHEKGTADFFNCIAFGKTAEVINQYCKKGKQIGIQGSIEFTKKDDKIYHSVKIVSVELLGSSGDSTNNDESQSQSNNKQYSKPQSKHKEQPQQQYNDDDDDEFPF